MKFWYENMIKFLSLKILKVQSIWVSEKGLKIWKQKDNNSENNSKRCICAWKLRQISLEYKSRICSLLQGGMASLDKLCLSAPTIFNYQSRFNYHPPPQSDFPIRSFRCCHVPKLSFLPCLILCLVTKKYENCRFCQNMSLGPAENRTWHVNLFKYRVACVCWFTPTVVS